MCPRLLATFLVLALSACASAPPRPEPLQEAPRRAAAPVCSDCGRIERIEVQSAVRATPQGGAVLGGVVGGVVSSPTSKPPTPKAKPKQSYRLTVRMEDGRRLKVYQNLISASLRIGSLVRVINGRIVPRH